MRDRGPKKLRKNSLRSSELIFLAINELRRQVEIKNILVSLKRRETRRGKMIVSTESCRMMTMRIIEMMPAIMFMFVSPRGMCFACFRFSTASVFLLICVMTYVQ